MPLLPEHQQTVDTWKAKGVLLAHHEQLLELWEHDQQRGYPFFRDSGVPSEAQFHEHERFGNMHYSAQLRIGNAHYLLEKITILHNDYLHHSTQPLPTRLFIDGDLTVAAFFAYLVSALETVAGQIILIYGLPIKLQEIHWETLIRILKEMHSPWDSRMYNEINYHTMSTEYLRNIVLNHGNNHAWFDKLIEYRNNYTHRTFFATILDQDGIYLPKNADILPSLAINPLEVARDSGNPVEVQRLKEELFNPLPLHEYCQEVLTKVRMLIEDLYPEIINTYQIRLEQPNLVCNPHSFYRLGL